METPARHANPDERISDGPTGTFRSVAESLQGSDEQQHYGKLFSLTVDRLSQHASQKK
jgi:hypothetical protein